MSKEPSPSLDWQRVLVVAIVILIGVEFILGAFMVNHLLYNVRSSSNNFTGVKMFASPYTSWQFHYEVRTEGEIYGGGFSGSGNGRFTINCPANYTMGASLSSDIYGTSIALEIWVRGEMRKSTNGTNYISASTVC